MALNVQAVVMAGGLGTRVRPLTFYFQKTMLPLGYRFRPALEYIIRNLVYHGIKDIVVTCRYKAEQVIGYLKYLGKYLRRLGVNMEYVVNYSAGTGHGLLEAYKKVIKKRQPRVVLVHYGDIITNLNVSNYVREILERDCDASIVVCKGYRLPVGVVEVDPKGTVKKLLEKPVLDLTYGIGVFTFTTKCLEELNKAFDMFDGELDIASHMLPYLIDRGWRVCAYTPTQKDFFWVDIGDIRVYGTIDHREIDERFTYLFKLDEDMTG